MTSNPATLDASVIISTRDRAEILRGTLENLCRQQPGGLTWEVIVADNGSSDDTPQVLADFADQLPLVTLTVPEPGKNRALNAALELARGELLMFTDDDVNPCDEWVQRVVAASHRWPDDSIFGGPVVPRFPPGTPDWVSSPDFEFTVMAFARYRPQDTEGPTPRPPFGPNVSFRRALLQRHRYDDGIGPSGKSYAMGSEAELLVRLRRHGERFIYVADAPVEHLIQPQQVTVDSLLRRAYRSGRGAARLSPRPNQVRVLGVPRFLWKKLAIALLEYPVQALRGTEARCVAGMKIQKFRGQIAEHRTHEPASNGQTTVVSPVSS